MKLTSPTFDDRELAAVKACLDSQWVTMGPWVKQFEDLVRERHAVSHALATTSGTAALHLAMMAVGVGRHDEVIVPALTWVTAAHCVEYVGGTPILVDVALDTFNIDPDAVLAAITPRTRAIIAVHLFGLSAPMREIVATAQRHGLAVVEDAACGIGTCYDGRPVGGLGNVGCFSFHPRKIVTTGEGGMVTTNDSQLARSIASLRNGGMADPSASPARPHEMGQFDRLGFNLRLSDLQGAVGVAQMHKLDRLLAERAQLAAAYDALLGEVDDIAIPSIPTPCHHTYQSYVVRVRHGGSGRRNQAMERMAADGIQTRPGTHAVHRLDYYRSKYGFRREDFPNASTAEDTTITLPLFPGMKVQEQERVLRSLRQGLG